VIGILWSSCEELVRKPFSFVLVSGLLPMEACYVSEPSNRYVPSSIFTYLCAGTFRRWFLIDQVVRRKMTRLS
jgi:hypothetical protein